MATPVGQADLYLNDIPVVRLAEQHAIRMPITEYTRRGSNLVQLRPGRLAGRWRETGEVAVRIEQARFEGETLIDLVTLLDGTAQCLPEVPGPINLGGFSSSVGAAPDTARFSEATLAVTPFVAAELRRVAALWRDRSWPALIAYLDAYIADYTSAYGVETRDNYVQSFTRMASAMMERGQVFFDETDMDLDICAGGKLIDCLSKTGGAAIKIGQPDGSAYDFNLVVGLAGREIVAVR